jgi:hypothetical protein
MPPLIVFQYILSFCHAGGLGGDRELLRLKANSQKHIPVSNMEAFINLGAASVIIYKKP